MVNIVDPEVKEWWDKKQSDIAPPTILQIELTKNCNLRCIMCHKGQVAPGEDFIRDDISDIALEQTRPLFPYLKKAMLFGDGEPMVYPKFWDVVRDIREASPNCVIDFINNGTMMHRKNIQKCLDYEVDKMGVSLGGASEGAHNKIRLDSSLEEIKENFLLMKKMKDEAKTLLPILSANIVVMRSNYKELPEFIEMCYELGFLFVNFQKLWVTHPSMEEERLLDEEVEPYFIKSKHVSDKHNMTLYHHPLESGNRYITHSIIEKATNEQKIFLEDPETRAKTIRQFQPHFDPVNDPGYCKNQEPWNTVYVLHNGKVVPDCHWWASRNEKMFDHCGILSHHNNILDIWNGSVYKEIRNRIQKIEYLPQCRGCGLAGGVNDIYRCEQTDHTDPEEEKRERKPIQEQTELVQIKIPKKYTWLYKTIHQKWNENSEIYAKFAQLVNIDLESIKDYPAYFRYSSNSKSRNAMVMIAHGPSSYRYLGYLKYIILSLSVLLLNPIDYKIIIIMNNPSYYLNNSNSSNFMTWERALEHKEGLGTDFYMMNNMLEIVHFLENHRQIEFIYSEEEELRLSTIPKILYDREDLDLYMRIDPDALLHIGETNLFQFDKNIGCMYLHKDQTIKVVMDRIARSCLHSVSVKLNKEEYCNQISNLAHDSIWPYCGMSYLKKSIWKDFIKIANTDLIPKWNDEMVFSILQEKKEEPKCSIQWAKNMDLSKPLNDSTFVLYNSLYEKLELDYIMSNPPCSSLMLNNYNINLPNKKNVML